MFVVNRGTKSVIKGAREGTKYIIIGGLVYFLLKKEGKYGIYEIPNKVKETIVGVTKVELRPENKDQLTNVLLYHVDDRNLSAAQIPAGSNFFKPILTSERTCITKDANGVTVADGTGDTANVIIADIKADNGVSHVIDKVLLPGTRPDCH